MSVFCRNFVWLGLVLVLVLEIWSHSIVMTIPELSVSARQAVNLQRPLWLPELSLMARSLHHVEFSFALFCLTEKTLFLEPKLSRHSHSPHFCLPGPRSPGIYYTSGHSFWKKKKLKRRRDCSVG